MKKTLWVFGLLFSYTISFSQGVSFIKNESWDSVLTKAKDTEKIIFIDAYTTWCGPCKKMDKVVFPLEEVGTVYNDRFINAKYDMEKGEGLMLAKKYQVFAYPTYLFVNGDGELLHRVAGFLDASKMLKLANIVSNPSQQLMTMQRRFQEGDRSPKFLYNYAYARQKAADKGHAKIATAYLATQKDWTTPENLKFVYDFTEEADSELFTFLVKNQDNFGEAVPKGAIIQKIQNISAVRIEQLLKKKTDSTIFAQATNLYKLIYPNHYEAKMESFKMQYYRDMGDRQGYANAAVAYVDKMGKEVTAGELNDIAWTFNRVITDKKLLKQALKWSKKALKEEKDVMFFESNASLNHKLGKKGKAKKVALEGLKIAKATDEDPTILSNLLREINQPKGK